MDSTRMRRSCHLRPLAHTVFAGRVADFANVRPAVPQTFEQGYRRRWSRGTANVRATGRVQLIWRAEGARRRRCGPRWRRPSSIISSRRAPKPAAAGLPRQPRLARDLRQPGAAELVALQGAVPHGAQDGAGVGAVEERFGAGVDGGASVVDGVAVDGVAAPLALGAARAPSPHGRRCRRGAAQGRARRPRPAASSSMVRAHIGTRRRCRAPGGPGPRGGR